MVSDTGSPEAFARSTFLLCRLCMSAVTLSSLTFSSFPLIPSLPEMGVQGQYEDWVTLGAFFP